VRGSPGAPRVPTPGARMRKPPSFTTGATTTSPWAESGEFCHSWRGFAKSPVW
jgi:hypothetical protein